MSAPEITENDLLNFYTAHFSHDPSAHFAANFLGPVEHEDVDPVEEDDGLGYYSDGVKRTLTDEQIAIFRHSEIQALLRKRKRAEESNNIDTDADHNTFKSEEVVTEADDEDAADEFSYAEPIGPVRPSSKKKSNKNNRKVRKAQEAREKGWFKQNVKPDLRKRTWDKVEQSVGTLAYDDEGGLGNQGSSSAPSRRKISYEDP
ncbi:cut8 proteasome-binding domain-containing protein [Rutstroemia sp. NJR-2017a BBW]|nr:cut8 proteasome-binding domain-containing protein [Rutstroemia sp. NJR-2017a BBW]